jgi:hypothetical protein
MINDYWDKQKDFHAWYHQVAFPTPCIIENFTPYCSDHSWRLRRIFKSRACAELSFHMYPAKFLDHTDSGQWWSKFCGHADCETREGDIWSQWLKMDGISNRFSNFS